MRFWRQLAIGENVVLDSQRPFRSIISSVKILTGFDDGTSGSGSNVNSFRRLCLAAGEIFMQLWWQDPAKTE